MTPILDPFLEPFWSPRGSGWAPKWGVFLCVQPDYLKCTSPGGAQEGPSWDPLFEPLLGGPWRGHRPFERHSQGIWGRSWPGPAQEGSQNRPLGGPWEGPPRGPNTRLFPHV